MSAHKANIRWARGSATFAGGDYSRDHHWDFPGGESLRASAAAAYQGNPDLVDPEQAFAASLSACHMLTFLALAAQKRLVVDSYTDDAEAILGKNEQGRMAVAKVILRPRISFDGNPPSPEELARLHERAHRACFIANSVSTHVDIE